MLATESELDSVAKTPRFEWYSFKPINSRNCLWRIVAGPRSIGKTFTKKLDKIKETTRNGRQFLWVRRTLTELRPAKSGFFDAIAPLFPGYEFRVSGYHGQVKKGEEWVTIVQFVALSTAYQMKGTEYSSVDEIVYDECFAEPKENGEPGTYLPDEVEKLRSLWITVNRKRVDRNGKAKTKVTLLGNVTAFDNPYFLEFNFVPGKEWQKSGDVILHLVDAKKYEQGVQQTMYGTALGTVAKDYAEGVYFRHDAGLYVDARPADAQPFVTLVTMRGTFSLWESGDAMYVEAGPLAALEKPVIAFEPLAVVPGVFLADNSHWLRQRVRTHYRRGSMFLVTAAASPARQALAR